MKSNKEENYWHGKIDFESQKTIIPFELNSVPAYKGGVYDFNISKDQNELLKEFTGGNELKVQIVLLAAVGMLLTKYNGEDLIRFGTPADRQKNDVNQDTIIPLELDMNRVRSFRELLNETKNVLVDGVFHQNYDFDLLWKKFNNYDENPLYDVICAFTNLQKSILEKNIKCNLVFEFTLKENELSGNILYNENKYSKSFIINIAKNFMEYLIEGLKNLDLSIDNICLASQADEIEFAVDKEIEINLSVVQKFQEIAENNPNSIAVEQGEYKLSFKELNEKSNKLAHYLFENGKNRNSTCIGVYLDNSIETIIAMMAV